MLSRIIQFLITTFTFRQFQYYAPEFANFYGAANAPKNIETPFAVIDYKGLKDQILALKEYTIQHMFEFSDPNRPFARLDQTKPYILKKADK